MTGVIGVTGMINVVEVVGVVGVPVQQLAGARGAADVARCDEDGGDHRRADTRVGEDLQKAGELGREGDDHGIGAMCTACACACALYVHVHVRCTARALHGHGDCVCI